MYALADRIPPTHISYREWILYAFLAHTLDQDPVTGLEYYVKAIAMLDFVRATWQDVDIRNRGAICENSFLFPLKALALRAYVDVSQAALSLVSYAEYIFSQSTPHVHLRNISRSLNVSPPRL